MKKFKFNHREDEYFEPMAWIYLVLLIAIVLLLELHLKGII